jgi:methylenetetrahydrofolate dehydrogenase (NADP+) / methenyltetrahydrofolate cyclohydrolase
LTATILDGRPLAATLRQGLRPRVQAFASRGMPGPSLRIVLIGEDEAGALYAERLRKSGSNLGISVVVDHYRDSLTPAELAGAIEDLNVEPAIDGVIVAMPLPEQLPSDIISASLDPTKDVDGITVSNAGCLYLGRPAHVPSTAAAILELLKANDVEIRGRDAVVVGRSPVVGKPAALLLLREHATVTVCHTRTKDLKSHTLRADILVAAAGRRHCIRGNMMKPGAVVIDAGINATEGGIVGDVDFDEAVEVAGAVTPVPGGVGPLTNVLLLRSVVENAERRLENEPE